MKKKKKKKKKKESWADNSDQADAYNQVTQSPHKAELSHELLGATASYEAMKAYEKHCAANGTVDSYPILPSDERQYRINHRLQEKPDSHAEAKELIAGFAGAFLDRVIETKGLDYIDKKKAQREAQNHVDEVVVEDNY
ncbi:hypothetical protein BDV36DRAFT_299179 [Aspergillus pseudocaelatus]|uniref:Uncharacterized protein n=1 Tax=Aspergillus pseudocaelatus TaxID=1825620 RepID=A0ABQ6WAV3_9EURO|nr:hypothetical protein BDV36DRAFT_299179 [Aspergillus pseudocaelatus]